MALTSISFATLYSTAQCILSVIGSVGVILLFAGIPQIIYAPLFNASNFITFMMGAILIVTMFLGNILLNYKFRRYRDRQESENGSNSQGNGPGGSNGNNMSGDPEDKPPSYDTVLTLDEPPPEYATIESQKPPKYDEIVKDILGASKSNEDTPGSTTTIVHTTTEDLAEETPPSQNSAKGTITTLNEIQEEVEEEATNSSEQSKNVEALATNVSIENEEKDNVKEATNQYLSTISRGRLSTVMSDDSVNTESDLLDESET